MRPCLRLVVCLMTAWLGVTPRAEEEIPSQGVVVRIYNAARATTRAMSTARGIADRILRDAGVQVGWRACGMPLPTPDACSDLVSPIELVLRVVSVSSPTSDPLAAYGASYIDTTTGSGTLATVYYDRVARAAERTHVPEGTLLGRVMAHEVGHLLLGTTTHAEDGLMRARWTDQHLAQPIEARLWRFSNAEAHLMRRTLLARNAQAVELLALNRAEH